MSTSLSDVPSYRDFCRDAAADNARFAGFREDPAYCSVVSSQLRHDGRDYLSVLKHRGFDLDFFEAIRDLDRVGGPTLLTFDGIGAVAPQTVRYVKVLSDLELLFGSLDGASIVEIGCGFGGQCAAIARRYRVGRYTLVDLPEPLLLARRYLDALAIGGVATLETDALPPDADYDLVISCYGLSEIRREVQEVYLARVLQRAAAGYLVWNNERLKQIRDWQLGQYGSETLYGDELIARLPGAHRLGADWMAAEDYIHQNQLIVWGDRPPD